jgi:hypothetical protein
MTLGGDRRPARLDEAWWARLPSSLGVGGPLALPEGGQCRRRPEADADFDLDHRHTTRFRQIDRVLAF